MEGPGGHPGGDGGGGDTGGGGGGDHHDNINDDGDGHLCLHCPIITNHDAQERRSTAAPATAGTLVLEVDPSLDNNSKNTI